MSIRRRVRQVFPARSAQATAATAAPTALGRIPRMCSRSCGGARGPRDRRQSPRCGRTADSPPTRLRSPLRSLPPRCTVPPSAVREHLTRHADDGATNVHRLLDAPWSDEALASDATRRLLAARLRQGDLRAFTRRRRWWTLAPTGGGQLTILDVCSGLGRRRCSARVWPEARVVMLDGNRDMDLTARAPQSRLYRTRSLRQERGRRAERRLGGRGVRRPRRPPLRRAVAAPDHALRARRRYRRSEVALLHQGHARQLAGSAKKLGRPNYDVILETLAEMPTASSMAAAASSSDATTTC